VNEKTPEQTGAEDCAAPSFLLFFFLPLTPPAAAAAPDEANKASTSSQLVRSLDELCLLAAPLLSTSAPPSLTFRLTSGLTLRGDAFTTEVISKLADDDTDEVVDAGD
jgi:hypothetical protein